MELRDGSNTVIWQEDMDIGVYVYQFDFCLAPGTYTFVITDSHGEGICCSYGHRLVTLSLNGATEAEIDDFDSEAEHMFDVPLEVAWLCDYD